MPSVARVVLPHVPHHVVQRGHNRQVVFAGDEDYARYLALSVNLKPYSPCTRRALPLA